MHSTREETDDRQATQNLLYQICAAFAVWASATAKVRAMAQAAIYKGDLPDAAQARDSREMVHAQIFEAYGRGQLQRLIVASVDDVDEPEQWDQHWRETWGPELTEAAAKLWAEQFAGELEQQAANRANAAAATAALDAAGVAP